MASIQCAVSRHLPLFHGQSEKPTCRGRLAVGSLFRASPVVGPAGEILLLNSAFVGGGLGVDLARRERSPAHDANNRVKLNRSACAVLAGALLGLPHLLVLLAGALDKKSSPRYEAARCSIQSVEGESMALESKTSKIRNVPYSLACSAFCILAVPIKCASG
jgi:hypothetical protein